MSKAQLLDLIRAKGTVFTKDEIALMWGETNAKFISRKIHRFLKSKNLYAIRRGIYAKDKNYNHDELATKIYTPSYISFETVLAREGVVFQYYGNIFIASYLSRELKIDGGRYAFKKIKDTVLNNTTGVEQRDGYFIASKERALLDTIYLYRNYYFDNLLDIDWEKVNEIIPIYENKRMATSVKGLERWAKREAKYDDVK